MKTRILSGVIMAPLLIFLIFKGYVLYAGCFLLSLMAIYEFFRGFKTIDIKPSFPIAVASTIVLYGFGLLDSLGITQMYPRVPAEISSSIRFPESHWFTFWVFATIIACLIYLFSIEKRKLEDAMVTMLGVFYIAFFCYHLGRLGMNSVSNNFVWLVVITAFGTDICAYFAGVSLGKHKLCPKISPKKTWEGAIGGIVGSMVLCALFGIFFIPAHPIHCLIIGLLGSIFSMFGDLTASIFKRKMGIKDYGNLIPGHGGILDRFDSILFTAPLVYYYIDVMSYAYIW